MQKLAMMFKAMADETRLQIMSLLVIQGELCVCDFEGLLDISQSKSSRHLRYLWNAGLVQNRRQGKWMYYRLPDAPDPDCEALIQALAIMIDDERRGDLLARLSAWFERKERDVSVSCTTQPA